MISGEIDGTGVRESVKEARERKRKREDIKEEKIVRERSTLQC